MAKKHEFTTAVAKAQARVLEQNPQDWGKREHCAMLRYLTLDAMAEAVDKDKKKLCTPEAIAAVGKVLKAVYESDDASTLAYASNMKKHLEQFENAGQTYE